MKVKLLKRLRKRYVIPKGSASIIFKEYFKAAQNCIIKQHITKYRLWYKLLTTITHK